jgi:hypothetical protein
MPSVTGTIYDVLDQSFLHGDARWIHRPGAPLRASIANDPNAWSRDVGDPRCILDLLARIVTVSLETMRIVDTLPVRDAV